MSAGARQLSPARAAAARAVILLHSIAAICCAALPNFAFQQESEGRGRAESGGGREGGSGGRRGGRADRREGGREGECRWFGIGASGYIPTPSTSVEAASVSSTVDITSA